MAGDICAVTVGEIQCGLPIATQKVRGEERSGAGVAGAHTVGVFGGHTTFGDPRRYWDFRSLGRGNTDFEGIICALNDIGYPGPLSVEWEDGRMDREHGATESAQFVHKIDFPGSGIVFDAQFEN